MRARSWREPQGAARAAETAARAQGGSGGARGGRSSPSAAEATRAGGSSSGVRACRTRTQISLHIRANLAPSYSERRRPGDEKS